MTRQQASTPEVQTLVTQASADMASRLHCLFRKPAMVAALGQERAERLTDHTAGNGSKLNWVSAEVREAIVERRAENKLGRFALWHLIDAIGWLQDCSAGRWPFMADHERQRRIKWASDELDHLEAAINAVSAQEASEKQADQQS